MKNSAFIFTGRENKLNFKASNAPMLVQLPEGLDNETWNYHLQRHGLFKAVQRFTARR